jgi:hypothetical protein
MSRRAAAVVLYTGEDAAAVPPAEAATSADGGVNVGSAISGAAGSVRGLAGAGRRRAKMLRIRRKRSTLEQQMEYARELAQQGADRLAQLKLSDRWSSSLDLAREYAQQGADRLAELNLAERLEAARGAASEGAGRLGRSGLVERLPDQVRAPVQQRLGARRRSRWWTIAWVTAAVVAGTVAALIVVKKALAPDYDELSLYEEDEPRQQGEPVAYPAAGSGSGWPEPQRTPENTETLSSRTNGPAATTSTPSSPPAASAMMEASATASSTPSASPASQGGGTVPADVGETPAPSVTSPLHEGGDPRAASTDAYREAVAAEGSASQQSGVEHALRPATGVVGPSMPAGPAGPSGPPLNEETTGRAGPYGPGVGAPPAPPSQPAERPPVPFTEQQAQMNAQLQLHQDQLLAAFPAMTRADIVACDGDLDRLAELIQPGAGMPLDAVQARLNEILLATSDTATNPAQAER